MSTELNKICGLDSLPRNKKYFILIREGLHHDSTFSLAQFAEFQLKSEGSVLFVSFRQSKNHYVNILSKFGVKVKDNETDESFVFIDGMKHLRDCILNATSDHKDSFINNLKELYQSIKSIWTNKISTNKSCLLIVDDLLILEAIGYPDRLIINFTNYLKSLTNQKGDLLISLHSSQVDKSANPLTSELAHTADIILDIDQLSTGYCSEIDGEVICTRQDLAAIHPPSLVKMHYHILPTGQVRYIAPGMSAAVI